MKCRIKVDEQWFEVEINDLTTRPVIAYVDGNLLKSGQNRATLPPSQQGNRLPLLHPPT